MNLQLILECSLLPSPCWKRRPCQTSLRCHGEESRACTSHHSSIYLCIPCSDSFVHHWHELVSPLSQMILPRSVAKLLHHRLSSEFAGLQDKSTLLQPRQNETIKYKWEFVPWSILCVDELGSCRTQLANKFPRMVWSDAGCLLVHGMWVALRRQMIWTSRIGWTPRQAPATSMFLGTSLFLILLILNSAALCSYACAAMAYQLNHDWKYCSLIYYKRKYRRIGR